MKYITYGRGQDRHIMQLNSETIQKKQENRRHSSARALWRWSPRHS